MKHNKWMCLLGASVVVTACGANQPPQDLNTGNTQGQHSQIEQHNQPQQQDLKSPHLPIQQKYFTEKIAQFDEPWALAILPNGHLLITQKKGQLVLFDPVQKTKIQIIGVPEVAYAGQGGLGDVVLHPNFAQNQILYLSYAEQDPQQRSGAVVIRARLDTSDTKQPRLQSIEKIWQQVPKVTGAGHYAHRILFDQQGKLWISSGERQKFDPAQDLKSNLGKIVHLNEDGSPVASNPFYAQGGVSAEIWSLGHRNSLGIAFDAKQQLWVVEMGPKGGDELNRVVRGENYGYPLVSNGDHYDGASIPDHYTRPEFKAPELDWTPVISPSSMLIYQGQQFPAWKDHALIGGLSSKAIVVVNLQTPVQEVQRLDMGQRIRSVALDVDGSIWVLEDGAKANLLKLTAPQ